MLRGAILASVGLLLLAGCALQQSTPKIAIDYNRDFAKSRNEMLLLNILRAAAREPLQFSTMGVVSGAVGNGGSLELPFTNLIAGGSDVISPRLTISDAINPTITITPLASKEFATGILSPIRTETVQLFLHNGWDAEFLLPLVVGAVVCPDGHLLLNSGEYLTPDGRQPTDLHRAFKIFFRDFARHFAVGQTVERKLLIGDKDILDALKSGLGPNLAVTGIGAAAESGKSVVTLKDSSNPAVRGNPAALAHLCQAGLLARRSWAKARQDDGLAELPDIRLSNDQAAAIAGAHSLHPTDTSAGPTGPIQPRIVFRSVGSVIQYLGESHRVRFKEGAAGGHGLTYINRDNRHQILFKIDWGLDDEPDAVATTFHGTSFRIPRIDLRRGEGDDRTLKALSFLDQLIALQTSENVIRGTQPVLTVTQ